MGLSVSDPSRVHTPQEGVIYFFVLGAAHMCLNVNIPDEAERLLREAFGVSLDRATLEALAIEGYRSGKFGVPQVRQVLGLADRWEAERWLGERGVSMNYTLEDLEDDRASIEKLFGKNP